MVQANKDIREASAKAGVYLWQVADKLGLHDSGMSRILRKELPEEKKAQIMQIITELSEEA